VNTHCPVCCYPLVLSALQYLPDVQVTKAAQVVHLQWQQLWLLQQCMVYWQLQEVGRTRLHLFWIQVCRLGACKRVRFTYCYVVLYPSFVWSLITCCCTCYRIYTYTYGGKRTTYYKSPVLYNKYSSYCQTVSASCHCAYCVVSLCSHNTLDAVASFIMPSRAVGMSSETEG
jgi:hypothetical protein